jgi:hypothetical protein
MNRLKQAWLALFKRKPKPPPPKSYKELALDELQAWRPIGGTFRYLGRKCVVTGYTRTVFSQLGPHWYIELSADYCDDIGVMRNVAFTMEEARAIMAAQPKPKVAKGKRNGRV